jgi:hypothetical protein
MDLTKLFVKLQEDIDKFKEDFIQADKNKSANRRARSTSMVIRNKLKKIRQQLLQLEKGA